MQVSVVIPAYNAEKFIGQAIESVQAQTFTDWELLVVDDCSADGTAQIVARRKVADERIHLLCQPANGGVAAARNAGVRAATGSWIAFLDSDDRWRPDKLEKQLALLEQEHGDLCYTGAEFIDDGGSPTGRCIPVPAALDYDTLLRGNDIICSSVLVRRTLFEAAPMRRSDLHEDFITWATLLKGGCRAIGLNLPLLQYRLTDGSKSRNKLKSAWMTWRCYGALGIKPFKRIAAFVGYLRHGIRRYYGMAKTP